MNVKKFAMLVTLIGMSVFFLAACGSKNADNKEISDGKKVDFKKDTMPDGNVIQIPADGEELPTDESESTDK